MGRVAVVAIDALERWYLEQALASGRLPNLARLRDRSARFTLDTPVAYRSELVWARFLSGREPLDDKDWAVSITFDPESYAVGLNSASTARPFYALGEGARVVALDLIHSAPADDVDGAQVVAWGAHSPQWPRSSRPAGLLTEIDRRFGTNPAFGNDFECGWHDAGFVERLTTECEVGGRRRAEIARWLLGDQVPDWDLFLVCASEFHSLGHHLWHGADPSHPLHGVAPTSDLAGARLADGLAAVDAAVGEVLAAVGPDTAVVLCALHGFQPADDLASTVLLPELVCRHLLGRRAGRLRDPDQDAWRRAGCPPVVPGRGGDVGRALGDAFADSAVQRVRRAAQGALPPGAYESLRRAAGRGVRPAIEARRPIGPEVVDVTAADLAAVSDPPTYQVAAFYRRHWARMPWFVLPSFADGHLRVNLAGREEGGIVEKEDYGRALDDIERFLGGCRDARTGAPAVAEVLRVRAADPMDTAGPDADLLVIWSGAPDALTHPDVGMVGPFPHQRMAHHSPRGFAWVAADGVPAGDRGARPSRDLTPTVLDLLGRDPVSPVRGSSLLDR